MDDKDYRMVLRCIHKDVCASIGRDHCPRACGAYRVELPNYEATLYDVFSEGDPQRVIGMAERQPSGIIRLHLELFPLNGKLFLEVRRAG